MSRAIGLYGDWSLSFLDAGNETGTMSGTARVVVGADDDSNLAAQIALWDAFRTKVTALVLGSIEKASYVNTAIAVSAPPTNGAARELKLLTIYQCTATGKRYSVSLPTLTPTIPLYIQNVSVKDAVRVDSPTAITEYITAFNNFVVAPDIPWNGSAYAVNPAITVLGLRVVGRNI